MLYALPKILRNSARQLLLSLGLISLASMSMADGLPTDTPENVGVSSQRLWQMVMSIKMTVALEKLMHVLIFLLKI